MGPGLIEKPPFWNKTYMQGRTVFARHAAHSAYLVLCASCGRSQIAPTCFCKMIRYGVRRRINRSSDESSEEKKVVARSSPMVYNKPCYTSVGRETVLHKASRELPGGARQQRRQHLHSRRTQATSLRGAPHTAQRVVCTPCRQTGWQRELLVPDKGGEALTVL